MATAKNVLCTLAVAILHVVTAVEATSNCTRLWAAGQNEYGQFGTGPGSVGDTEPFPVHIGTFEDGLLDVAVGGRHSVLVKSDGSAWTAGDGRYGRLGHNDTIDRPTFTRVHGVQNAVHSCAGVKAVAGFDYTFFLSANGEVHATGQNDNGQLAVGDTMERLVPVKVPLVDVVDIYAGIDHTIFTTSNGTIYAAGSNGNGQLCIGDNDQRTSPVRITGLPDNITGVAAGGYHSIFWTGGASASTCGWNQDGQLGLGDNDDRTIPSMVNSFSPHVIMSAAASFQATIFLLSNGQVHSTGYNNFGVLGVGDNSNRNAPTVISIDDVAKVYSVMGPQLFIAREDGTVWATGNNAGGELGVDDIDSRNVPVDVSTLAEEGVSFVAGGGAFTLFAAHDSCSNAPSLTPTTSSGPSSSPSISRMPSQSPTEVPCLAHQFAN